MREGEERKEGEGGREVSETGRRGGERAGGRCKSMVTVLLVQWWGGIGGREGGRDGTETGGAETGIE